MIRIWAKVMAENVLLSSPRWADKQMPDPGLALRQEAKIRPATAPGDLLSRPISGAKKNSLTIVTRSLDANRIIPRYLFPFQSLQSSFCGRTNSRRGSKICETKHLFLICKTSKQEVKRMNHHQMIGSAVGSHSVTSICWLYLCLCFGFVSVSVSISVSVSVFEEDGDQKCCWQQHCPSICVRRVATRRLTNAWVGPLPSSGVPPRPDIPKPAPHLHQSHQQATTLRGKQTAPGSEHFKRGLETHNQAIAIPIFFGIRRKETTPSQWETHCLQV